MLQPKVIGMIGGIAPPSTIDYYQKIIAGFQAHNRTNHYPSILMNSIDMTKMLDLISERKLETLVQFLSDEIKKLQCAGADFVFLASNTPHIVFEELQRRTRIPLISIVESCVDHAVKHGFTKLGLFGTKSTMQSGFYQAGFAQHNIDVVVPLQEQQEFIHEKYMSELVKGVYAPETKNRFMDIAAEMMRQQHIEALILGGTELPFLLRNDDLPALPLLNTTEIHVASILAQALSN